MKAEHLMTRALTCGPGDTLNRAAQLMWDHDVGMLPVVDSELRPIGAITDRDICMAAYTQGGPLWALRVETAMAKTVFTCRLDDTVSTAAETMQQKRVRRLPVVDIGGRVAGVLSLDDLATQAAADRASRVPAVKLEEVGATVAALCQPRIPTIKDEAVREVLVRPR
jgi:CBS domain-containing protein